MFKVKHRVTFNTGANVSLYGEDYFGDKKVFWDFHQTQLKGLLHKAQSLGGSFTVVEHQNEQELKLVDLKALIEWLSKSHPIKI